MKRLLLTLAVVAVAVTSCQKDVVYNDVPEQNQSVEIANSNTRSYEEALAIAEDALTLLEGDETRSATKRVIKRNEGQTVMRPVTRGSETSEEPIMYVFNNEDNQGFTVVAADKSKDPLIAVTELGSYTYGEPTGVEAFDAYMDNIGTTLAFNPPSITPPQDPLVPTPGSYIDTVNIYERVDPLISTKWSQSGVFGSECDNQTSGCAATAFGQIMAYHEYPLSMNLTHAGNTLLLLKWSEIKRIITGNEIFFGDYVAKKQVGDLLREIGERMDMTYFTDGSSGTNEYKMLAGIHSLGYSASTLQTNTSVDNLYYTIKSDIQNGNPVIITGRNINNSGHTWIADGVHRREYSENVYVENPNYNPSIIYNNPEPKYILVQKRNEVFERLFHYNWGSENGVCNGWFTSSCYDVNAGESYDNTQINNQVDSSNNYIRNICIIYNIKSNN